MFFYAQGWDVGQGPMGPVAGRYGLATCIWPRGYKTFYMLNSADHEILNAQKHKIRRKFSTF